MVERRVLVTGDRNWRNRARTFGVMDAIHAEGRITLLIEGCADGADQLAGDHANPRVRVDGRPVVLSEPGWAAARGVPGGHFPADWDRYHRAAGPVRNGRMLVEGGPVSLVVAFHDDLARSKGTADMIRQARRMRIPVRVFTSEGEVNGD